ncbi:MAG: pyruvate ferredoxin oxidoreductase [Deltaproteobacteria bacterium]|nr:pyruvate ferredoxin oxidoreductase [Deltaproteobacteria bacterium]
MEIAKNVEKITIKNMPEFEALASGHRACQGCGEVLALRQALKALDENVIVVSATGCMEVITTPYPQTAWHLPWMHVAFENASAVGSGVIAARKALARKGKLDNNNTKVVIMGGDGGTADIGFQSLSGALERGHDFIYLCFDNEAYMNTGIQRSSSTPRYAWTTTCPIGECQDGKGETKKDLPAIVAKHNVPYVATTTPAHPVDLMNKVRKAAATAGPAFVHILSPCPTGWRMQSKDIIKIAKLAVDSRMYPLFEIVDGKYIMGRTKKKPVPVSDYLKAQGRFKHMGPEEQKTIQYEVDKKFEELIRLSTMED